jgi:hypothetical protein
MLQKDRLCFDCQYCVEDYETPNFGYCRRQKEVVEKETACICKDFKPKERVKSSVY